MIDMPDPTITPATNASVVFRPASQRALRQEIAASLLTAVFQGRLQEGAWLNAQKLAQQFGVSATPVREALVELATIGMVEMQHNRGTVVRSFGPVQLREIYQLRQLLESEATRRACPHLAPEALKELRQGMTGLLESSEQTAGWSDRVILLDRCLHELIARHCDNRRLTEEISRYHTLVQCIRDVVANQSYAQMQALPEHMEIIEALLKHAPERAAAAMAAHIQSSARVVEQALFPAAVAERKTPSQIKKP